MLVPLVIDAGASLAHVGRRCPGCLVAWGVDPGEGGASKLGVPKRVLAWHPGGDGGQESLGNQEPKGTQELMGTRS